MAQSPQQGGQAPSAGGLSPIFMFVFIFVIFWVLVIAPQRKKEKEHRQKLAALKKNDLVITSGGIYGSVVGIKDNIVVLKVAENVKMEFQKNAISTILES